METCEREAPGVLPGLVSFIAGKNNRFGFEGKIRKSIWTCQCMVLVECPDKIQNYLGKSTVDSNV